MLAPSIIISRVRRLRNGQFHAYDNHVTPSSVVAGIGDGQCLNDGEAVAVELRCRRLFALGKLNVAEFFISDRQISSPSVWACPNPSAIGFQFRRLVSPPQGSIWRTFTPRIEREAIGMARESARTPDVVMRDAPPRAHRARALLSGPCWSTPRAPTWPSSPVIAPQGFTHRRTIDRRHIRRAHGLAGAGAAAGPT